MSTQYRITFGRTDGPIKGTTLKSKARAIKLANYLAYVFFAKYPFNSRSVDNAERYEGEGFFVELCEEHYPD